MKITDVKIRFVEGVMPPEERSLDMRLRNAVHYLPTNNHYDITPTNATRGGAAAAGGSKQIGAFLYIETDEGITGVAGSIMYPDIVGAIIKGGYRGFLIGEDPLNIERIWDVLYRRDLYNHAGYNILALSTVDIALWDIRCKKAGMPLWQMAGGATQRTLPAYANCVGGAYKEDGSGFDLDEVARLTQWCVDNGFTGSKWYPHRGPADGQKGIDEIYEMFKIIREVAGPDFKLLLDVWSSWDVYYTLRVAEKLAKLDFYWIEEPIMPKNVDGYATLNRKSPVSISAGENIVTRWSIKEYLDKDALEIYQPDPVWCGGVSECLKIMNLITMYSKRIALHAACVPISTQLAATCANNVHPICEYLLYISPGGQFFYKNQFVPINGDLHLPDAPGAGLDIDENKVTRSWFME